MNGRAPPTNKVATPLQRARCRPFMIAHSPFAGAKREGGGKGVKHSWKRRGHVRHRSTNPDPPETSWRGHPPATTSLPRIRSEAYFLNSAGSIGSDTGSPRSADRSIAIVNIRLRWPSAAVAWCVFIPEPTRAYQELVSSGTVIWKDAPAYRIKLGGTRYSVSNPCK